jgi:hypothetical protein
MDGGPGVGVRVRDERALHARGTGGGRAAVVDDRHGGGADGETGGEGEHGDEALDVETARVGDGDGLGGVD